MVLLGFHQFMVTLWNKLKLQMIKVIFNFLSHTMLTVSKNTSILTEKMRIANWNFNRKIFDKSNFLQQEIYATYEVCSNAIGGLRSFVLIFLGSAKSAT